METWRRRLVSHVGERGPQLLRVYTGPACTAVVASSSPGVQVCACGMTRMLFVGRPCLLEKSPLRPCLTFRRMMNMDAQRYGPPASPPVPGRRSRSGGNRHRLAARAAAFTVWPCRHRLPTTIVKEVQDSSIGLSVSSCWHVLAETPTLLLPMLLLENYSYGFTTC